MSVIVLLFFCVGLQQASFQWQTGFASHFCFLCPWLIRLLQASNSLSLLTDLSKFVGGTMNASLSSCLPGTEQTAWLISLPVYLPVFLFARLFV